MDESADAATTDQRDPARPTHPSGPTTTPGADPRAARDDGAPTRDEMTVALTPGQMAVGGAIVAGLLVVGVRLILGRRRGRG